MAGRGRYPSDDDLDLDDDSFEEPKRPSRTVRPPRRTPRSPVRAWDAADEPPDEEWDDERPSRFAGLRGRTPVYWRARDSLYFEPLVALAIVVLLLVGLYAYAQTWPPAYVVESRSMQHGPNDDVGIINAGDLVLSEKVPASSIVPYVVGYRDNVHTYGEFGDVVLYHPNGVSSGTPIVHRAIVYLQWNGHNYSAPELRGLPCGDQSNMTAGELYYSTLGTGHGSTTDCVVTNLTGELQLFHVGWDSVTINITLSWGSLGNHSGFLTLGDDNHGLPDQTEKNGGSLPSLSTLVEPAWVIGVARGMIPWFGAVKLLLQGNAGNVSPGSWQFLGLSIIGLIFAAFGVHYALRAEGVETPLRRREEEEAAEERGDEPDAPHRLLRALRPWHAEDDDEEVEETPPPRVRRPPAAESSRPSSASGNGRPRPRVHRTHRRRRDDDL